MQDVLVWKGYENRIISSSSSSQSAEMVLTFICHLFFGLFQSIVEQKEIQTRKANETNERESEWKFCASRRQVKSKMLHLGDFVFAFSSRQRQRRELPTRK